MATLPDIDTSEVSFIAFWNAIDQGGIDTEDFDAEDVLSDSQIEDQTLYDNGVVVEWEPDMSLAQMDGDPRLVRCRVKNDGWFVAYLDRTESFNHEVEDKAFVHGPWDIINDWTLDWDNDSIEENYLERAINSLQGELDASPAYASSEVGLYNYMHEDADFVTHLGHAGPSNSNSSVSETVGFLYTSNTTIHYAVAAVTSEGEVTWDPDGADEFHICDGFASSAIDVRDFEGTNYIPNANEEYHVRFLDTTSHARQRTAGDFLFLWEDSS